MLLGPSPGNFRRRNSDTYGDLPMSEYKPLPWEAASCRNVPLFMLGGLRDRVLCHKRVVLGLRGEDPFPFIQIRGHGLMTTLGSTAFFPGFGPAICCIASRFASTRCAASASMRVLRAHRDMPNGPRAFDRRRRREVLRSGASGSFSMSSASKTSLLSYPLSSWISPASPSSSWMSPDRGPMV